MRPGPLEREVRLGLRTAFARSYPRIFAANREPSWVFFEVVMPALTMSALVLVYHALHAPDRFTGFVVIGSAMTAFWMNSLWSMGMQLNWEKSGGNLDIWMMAPANTIWILAGMAFGSIITSATRALAVTVVGLLMFHATFQSSGIPAALLAVLVGVLGVYALGALMASVFLAFGRVAFRLEQVAQDPVIFFTGAYFPVRSLGTLLSSVAALIPLTLTLDAIRQSLYPDATPLLPYWTELAILLVLGIALAFAAERALAYMENLGKRRGTMGTKWN